MLATAGRPSRSPPTEYQALHAPLGVSWKVVSRWPLRAHGEDLEAPVGVGAHRDVVGHVAAERPARAVLHCGRRRRRLRRGLAVLPEVRGHRLVLVDVPAVDPVLDLTELRAAVPLAGGPRVGLPSPLDLAVVEEAVDGPVAAVRAGTVPAEDGRDAVEVRVDGSLVAGGRVEIEAEVDGAVLRRSEGVRLAQGRLGLGDAARVAVERVVGAPLPVEHDVEAGLLDLGLFALGEVLPGRVVAQIAHDEREALRLQVRERGPGPGVVGAVRDVETLVAGVDALAVAGLADTGRHEGQRRGEQREVDEAAERRPGARGEVHGGRQSHGPCRPPGMELCAATACARARKAGDRRGFRGGSRGGAGGGGSPAPGSWDGFWIGCDPVDCGGGGGACTWRARAEVRPAGWLRRGGWRGQVTGARGSPLGVVVRGRTAASGARTM